MCTVISFNSKDHYFGRNLDLDHSYNEEVCIMPRNFELKFRKLNTLKKHYAMIGMATIINNEPLFYDATNEYGLSMAGLNFPNNAFFFEEKKDLDNVTPFEFIPWILAQCKSVDEALILLSKLNLVNIAYSDSLSLSPLHWMISDKYKSITVESMIDGLHIHNNPVGVLTNNPPFEYQMFNLNNYRNLKNFNGDNLFSKNVPLTQHCQGLGSVGLPGDVSSMSRFVRMVFNKENSSCLEDENSAISQFFHLLTSVEMINGSCKLPNGKYDYTIYSSCVNTDKGIYYYTSYNNRTINAINMHNVDLNSSDIIRYSLVLNNQIQNQN